MYFFLAQELVQMALVMHLIDDGSWSKIPQTGSVVIEDNVDIGANTTIDCGAIDDTTIIKQE